MHVYLPCRITHRVRKLLMLIPTDPQISETLECIANKVRLNRPTEYSKCVPICISVSYLVHLISCSSTLCEYMYVALSYTCTLYTCLTCLYYVDELTKCKLTHTF